MTRDLSTLATWLRSAVTARADYDRRFTRLLDELGVASVEDEARVMAMVHELADADATVTEADARELLRRTDR